MNLSRTPREDQSELWNGAAGRAWVEQQALLDEVFKPLEHLLAEAASAKRASRVLDVGCGTGGTTVGIAGRLGSAGECVGVDISGPMIEAARDRAGREGAQATFIEGDAQTAAFEPDSFDLIVSRFGVMFFADPVAAFANLRRATRPGGELLFLAWRGADENPFMTAAERAAAPLMPDLPARSKDGPGQFAFADADHVRGILEKGGWSSIEIDPIDFACAFPEAELTHYLTRLGPLGRVLIDADEGTRARIVEAVRPAFDPWLDGGKVRFTAACWRVAAQVR